MVEQTFKVMGVGAAQNGCTLQKDSEADFYCPTQIELGFQPKRIWAGTKCVVAESTEFKIYIWGEYIDGQKYSVEPQVLKLEYKVKDVSIGFEHLFILCEN